MASREHYVSNSAERSARDVPRSEYGKAGRWSDGFGGAGRDLASREWVHDDLALARIILRRNDGIAIESEVVFEDVGRTPYWPRIGSVPKVRTRSIADRLSWGSWRTSASTVDVCRISKCK